MKAIDVINKIRQDKGAEIPALQQEFNASYKEIKQIVDELVGNGKLLLVSGIKYVCVEENPPGAPRRRPETRRLGEQTVMDVFEATDKRQKDFFSDVIESGKKEKRNSFFVNMRRTQPLETELDDKKEDGEENNKEEKKEEKEKKREESIFNSLLEDVNQSGGKKEPTYSIDEIFDKYVRRQITPITAEVMPKHTAWIDEKKFVYEVKEHLENLIKSDKKMRLSGAVEKAQMLLDAVRETNDKKTIQVYERMVYELLIADSKLYGQLKNKYFAE